MFQRKITSNFVTLLNNDVLLDCSALSSNVIVYLEASKNYDGEYTIKKTDIGTNTVTIIPISGETIDGSSSIVITLKNQYKTLKPVNGGWTIIDETNSVRWDDLFFPLNIGKPTAGGKPDYDYTNFGWLFPRNDATEIMIIMCQMPHRWKLGSTIYPHVHWRQTRNEQAVFKMAYKWYNIGDTEPADFTVYEMGTYVKTYSSGTLHQINDGTGGIDGTGKGLSSMLLIKLYREDNVYAADALVDQFDIHIEIDSMGSNEEYHK